MQWRIIWPIEFTKLKFYLQKLTKGSTKEIIVISIKANNRDPAKNLKLRLNESVFSQVRSLKIQVLCTHS